MKTACIIQGNIREGFELVLHEMKKHFDVVIVSTWEDEVTCIPSGDHIVLFNEKPLVTGFSHRNYQRYSTARGLDKARELGCDYVLKWRTDMLPTKLNISQLITWANTDIPPLMTSRVVTCAFRNLTVHEDWFSSIPDLFAFGHIDTMDLLWGDIGFDYSKMFNPPMQMLVDEGCEWQDINNLCDVWDINYKKIYSISSVSQKKSVHNDFLSSIWCAESELYSIFKDRLQRQLNLSLNHEKIVKTYMYLVNHHELKIVWFGNNGKMRPIFNGCQIPWWTNKQWLKSKAKMIHKGYQIKGYLALIKKKLNCIVQILEIQKQKKYFEHYKK